MPIIIFLPILIFGLVIGSFLNVCIFRLPKHENIVYVPSHCMSCGYHLKWYDLIPVFSYAFLGGKCRKCKEKISVQYPLIEVLNGGLYVLIFALFGLTIDSLLCCFLASALIVVSLIDFRTYEIPDGLCIFILALGLVRVFINRTDWSTYVIGLFSVSVFLYILYQVSRGAAIGGGDVKLMGAAGLFLGWKLGILAFVLGCILGAIIHVLRMRISKAKGKDANHVLAMGPYLSMGILIAALFGDRFLSWYLSFFLV